MWHSLFLKFHFIRYRISCTVRVLNGYAFLVGPKIIVEWLECRLRTQEVPGLIVSYPDLRFCMLSFRMPTSEEVSLCIGQHSFYSEGRGFSSRRPAVLKFFLCFFCPFRQMLYCYVEIHRVLSSRERLKSIIDIFYARMSVIGL
jgi:hypothetical protein